jgi:hypothetical protein
MASLIPGYEYDIFLRYRQRDSYLGFILKKQKRLLPIKYKMVVESGIMSVKEILLNINYKKY